MRDAPLDPLLDKIPIQISNFSHILSLVGETGIISESKRC